MELFSLFSLSFPCYYLLDDVSFHLYACAPYSPLMKKRASPLFFAKSAEVRLSGLFLSKPFFGDCLYLAAGRLLIHGKRKRENHTCNEPREIDTFLSLNSFFSFSFFLYSPVKEIPVRKWARDFSPVSNRADFSAPSVKKFRSCGAEGAEVGWLKVGKEFA